MMVFLTGVVLGVAGSGHCVGMCGPLVLTLGRTLARPTPGAQVQHSLTYHAGRVLTYVMLAIPAGLAGRALTAGGFGRALAVSSGVVILLFAAGSIRAGLLGRLGGLASAVATRACIVANRWSRLHPVAGPLATGAANGLIPCGLVYSALTAATATGNPADAVVMMLGFGMGTIPALIAVTLAAATVAPALRMRLRRLTPIVLIVVAALLIMRGLTTYQHVPDQHTTPGAIAHH